MNRTQKWKAWSVHLYTATGLIFAAGIGIHIVNGTTDSFYWAFAFMGIATFIDATDGYLARRFDVKRWVPEFDGRRLDDLTDFLNYTFLPLLLIWRANLAGDYAPWLLFPLIASAYGFCQVSAKTDDGFFLGFPSYWNLAAFYLFLLKPSPETTVICLIALAFLTFVPFRYLYSTQPGKLNRYTNYLAGIWGVQVAQLMILGLQGENGPKLQQLTYYSLAFPTYYMITSWLITWRLSRRAAL